MDGHGGGIEVLSGGVGGKRGGTLFLIEEFLFLHWDRVFVDVLGKLAGLFSFVRGSFDFLVCKKFC